jgi:hypothetical protein
MELYLKIAGIFLIVLASAHIVFPKYFNWKQDLSSLSAVNRQMMYVHSFFIAFAILLMGMLCMTSTAQLIHTPLGKRISLGLGLFWTARLAVQFFGYSSKLWKGKKFETIMHILLAMLWTYLSIVFVLTYLA